MVIVAGYLQFHGTDINTLLLTAAKKHALT